MKYMIFKHPMYSLLTIITLILGVLLLGGFGTMKASAEINASHIFPDPNASSNTDLYMTIGGGEFQQPRALSVIVSDAPGTFVITIDESHWCNDDGLYAFRALDLPKAGNGNAPYTETKYTVKELNGNLPGNTIIGAGTDDWISSGFAEECGNRNQTLTFTLDNTDLHPDTKKYTAIFWAESGAVNRDVWGFEPGAWENSFRIIVNGPGTRKALPVPSNYGGSSFFSLSNRNRNSNESTNYQITFNTPCSLATQEEASLQFTDVDNGIYQDAPPTYPWRLTYEYREGPRGGPLGEGHVEVDFGGRVRVPYTGDINGGNNEDSTKLYGKLNGNKDYLLNINGLSWINAISYSINVPVAALTASDDCRQNQPATMRIDGATCDKVWGFASDPDVPSGGLTVHLRMEFPYPTKTELDGDLRTRADGYWEYNVDPKYKDDISRVVYASVLGIDQNGGWEGWVDAPTSGTFRHGPCFASECRAAVIENVDTLTNTYPNSKYRLRVTFRNTGSATWTSGDIGGASQATVTNNYLTDGGGVEFITPGIANVPPGWDVIWTTSDYTLPAHGSNTITPNYNSFWKLGSFTVANARALRGEAGGTWFGPQCGMEFTVVQGRLGDAEDWNTYREGVIDNCNSELIKTGSGGFFTFAARRTDDFCIRLSSATVGYDNVFVRPFDWNASQGYLSCAPNAVCTTYGTYECQGAGTTYGPVCGFPNIDRSIDYGYDLALAWKPDVRCTILDVSGDPEVGISYAPQVRVFNYPPVAGSSAAITGTTYYSIDTSPVANRSGAITPAIPRGGDQIVTMSPNVTLSTAKTYNATGYVIWSSNMYSNQRTDCPASKPIAGNLPYLKIYGGDVWAGGAFGTGACTAPAGSGGVAGWARSVDAINYAGTSSQLTITSLLNVNNRGFYSVSTRPGIAATGNTYQPKGLSFANYSTSGTDTYGLDYSDGGRCFEDYYTTTQDPTILEDDSFNGGGIPDNRRAQYVLPANTDATFGNFDIKRGVSAAVFVDGDLYIDGNIFYENSIWRDQSDIPMFAVVVRGNIYIDNDVTRLDGMYIAQPKTSGGGGYIYTCYPVAPTKGPAYNSTNLYTNCQNQLSVNGALLARQVKFLRARNSLKDANTGEMPNFLTGSGTNAAEVINYGPEMYIADSPLKEIDDSPESTRRYRYDAISGLPPIY